MDSNQIKDIIKSGETSTVQFKRDFDNSDKIAAEMIAMSNAAGGMIIFGVDDKTGEVIGFDYDRLQFIGNKISTIASDSIKPQIYVSVEVVPAGDADNGDTAKKVLIVHIDEGTAKPYKDNNGTIWIKQGPDKRKVSDNNEILRLFQQSGLVYADEMIIPDTGINDIDKEKVSEYLEKAYFTPDIHINIDNEVLYHNLHILKKGHITLAGALFFTKHPQRYRPAFCVKAIAFYGNNMGGLYYRDSRDIIGAAPELFRESMLFFKANLRHIQKNQNFNSVGILEISETALEELIQNAIIHRDYTQNSPIRLMIFDNRIEIISPGRLPNNLTTDSIKLGAAVIRNNLTASYAAKLMRYRGFGTGIIRAYNEQPNIELYNDIEANQFIVKIPRG